MKIEEPINASVKSKVILKALQSAVHKALDKKRRLGQYAVVWDNKTNSPKRLNYISEPNKDYPN